MKYKIEGKKVAILAVIISVLSVIPLISIQKIKSHKINNNLLQQRISTATTSHTRQVTNFTSKHTHVNNNNFFRNLQNKFASARTQISLSNTANFSYQLRYLNYQGKESKKSNFSVNVAKHTSKKSINVVSSLISAITVKISAPNQKWANLTMTKNFTQTEEMMPSSIHYAIVGANTINNANVFFEATYKNRKNPSTILTSKLGFFNVTNINKNTKKFFGSVEGQLTIGAISVLGLAIISLVSTAVMTASFKAYISVNSTKLFQGGLEELLAVEKNGVTSQFVDSSDSTVNSFFSSKDYTGVRKRLLQSSSAESIQAFQDLEPQVTKKFVDDTLWSISDLTSQAQGNLGSISSDVTDSSAGAELNSAKGITSGARDQAAAGRPLTLVEHQANLERVWLRSANLDAKRNIAAAVDGVEGARIGIVGQGNSNLNLGSNLRRWVENAKYTERTSIANSPVLYWII